MIDTNLAPGLLLAMPQLIDPNFSRAVVLMIEHNDEGSFGLIVNKPIELSALELLESMEIDWNGDGDTLVWSGGPVSPTSGWILHEPIDEITGESAALGSAETILVRPDLALSSSRSALSEIAKAPPPRTRLLLGYSGWGPGQLAAEMARGSWLHADANPKLIFETPADEMWDVALRSLGIDPQTIVQGFGVH
ncbi:MAG: YqgE/AlgH family protein [Proteobacteria bacterium]|nr:YqgE/AlgH family protein [Pseudomonadota bacterium]